MLDTFQHLIQGFTETQLSTPLVYVVILILGFVASLGSCCNLGVIGAITSYAGAQHFSTNRSRNTGIGTGVAFFIGNVISLSIIGLLTGFVSQSIGVYVGYYWKLIAGVVVVYFGLSSLDVLPVSISASYGLVSRMSQINIDNKGFVFGMALGGFTMACSVGCNPAFPLALGVSYIQKEMLSSWFIMLVFAVGYSIPLTGIIVGLGVGLDRFSETLFRNKDSILFISGIALTVIGFGLLSGLL